MFAGGDAKLLIALGAIIPLSDKLSNNLINFSTFFVLFLIAGAIYGISVSSFFAVRNFGNVKKEFSKNFIKYKNRLIPMIILGVFVIAFSFFERIFLFFGILFLIYPFLFLFARSVEEGCMIKEINPKKLREGDWLYRDLKIGKKVIKAKFEGLNKNEIQIIRKAKKNIRVREGVPFGPVFLITFLVFIALKLLDINLWNSFW
jgi:hypothetical protein